MPWMTEGTVHEQGGVRQSLGRRLSVALETRGKKREFAPWNFPGGPAGKTWHAQSRAWGSIPGQETRSHLRQQSSCELQLRPRAAKIYILKREKKKREFIVSH